MNIYFEYTPKDYKKRASSILSNFSNINAIHVVFSNKAKFHAFHDIFGDFSKNIVFDVYNPINLKHLVKMTNRKKHHPTILIIIDKELSSKDKKALDKLHSTFLINDLSNNENDHQYYLSNKYILFSNHHENQILLHDLRHQYLFKELRYQCLNSSCLGNTLYISKNDEVSFCPHHIKESLIGKIGEDYFNNEKFLELKEKCKESCPFKEDKMVKELIKNNDFSLPVPLDNARYADQILELKRIATIGTKN